MMLAAGGEIIKLADAAGVPMILLNNDLDEKQWAEYGRAAHEVSAAGSAASCPTTRSGGYGIAEAVLIEAARIKKQSSLEASRARRGDQHAGQQ